MSPPKCQIQKNKNKVIARKRKTVEEEEESVLGGTYEPADILVEREGGASSEAAREAAAQYIAECMRRGGKWIRYNSFTKRPEYLYLKSGTKKVSRQKWTMEEERRKKQCVLKTPPPQNKKQNEQLAGNPETTAALALPPKGELPALEDGAVDPADDPDDGNVDLAAAKPKAKGKAKQKAKTKAKAIAGKSSAQVHLAKVTCGKVWDRLGDLNTKL